MSTTLQVHLPDAVHDELTRRAAGAGVSLSEYVVRELERVAARPLVEEVFARSVARRVDMSADDVVATIHAERMERSS